MSVPQKNSAARPGFGWPGARGRDFKQLASNSQAFTLIELLIVIAIIAIVASLLLPALARAKASARSIQCLNQMRQIGLATRLYSDDNQNQFPRSQHSAAARRQLVWERALAPQFRSGGSDINTWTNLISGIYHCPEDFAPKYIDYGINAYFELEPPEVQTTWHRVTSIPIPSSTICFCEIGNAKTDHVMPEDWELISDATLNDILKPERHLKQANYIFVDGHAAHQKFVTTFNPASDRNLWNPATAK